LAWGRDPFEASSSKCCCLLWCRARWSGGYISNCYRIHGQWFSKTCVATERQVCSLNFFPLI